VLDHLDAGAARRWVVDVLEQLSARREEIDDLNVYPVPDGDTGTNLCLTVEAGAAAVDDVPDEDGLPGVTDAFARGALLGARGSSGIILSQLLRGLAEVLRERPDGGAAAVRAALTRAADQAYAAVGRPVEGTMLTVARAAAEGAQGRTLREVVSGAVEAARGALARTTEQLDVLSRAGVVDAGGRGLLVVLESLSATVHGRRDGAVPSLRGRTRAARTPARRAGGHACDAPPSGPAYEVMYLLDAADDTVPAMRAALDGLGDALVVVGGAGLWNVHVHTDDPASAVAQGRAAGRVRRLRVTSFAHQRLVRRAGVPDEVGATAPVVVVGAPVELVALVADHGAHLVPDWTPLAGRGDGVVGDAAAELEELVRSLCPSSARGAAAVALVPASVPAAASAESVARTLAADGRAVEVLPTCSVVPALAAISVHDPAAETPDDCRRMAGAASSVRCGEVLWSAAADDGADVVGTVQGQQVASGRDPGQVALAVVERLVTDRAELLTVLPGQAAGGPGALAVQALVAEVRRRHPTLDVTVLPSVVTPRPCLQLGVE
jgi:DAK2 domain fusion protein YloV